MDSSDEEPSVTATAATAGTSSRAPPPLARTIATQTTGSLMEHALEFVESSLATLVLMNPIKNQFWAHMLSCMKMPRGGVAGGGSMHCSVEFVASNEEIVQYLMEDLPVQQHHRYNLSLPPPHWEPSPSISTYHALGNGSPPPRPSG